MSSKFKQNGSAELEHLSRQSGLSRRDFMSRAAAMGLLPAATQLLATGAFAQTPVPGGLLRIGLDGGDTTDSLDPRAYIGTPHVSQVFSSIYDSLVLIKPGGELGPMLAESWDSNADATEWRFVLRQGVTFHDGRPFGVDDVIYSAAYLADELNIRAPVKSLLQAVASVEADGDNAVVFKLNTSNYDFATMMGIQGNFIVPAGTTDFTAPVGTGPYVLESYEPGIRARLIKYDEFWTDEEGHFDEVEIINIADASTRTSALRNGDVDVIYRPDIATASRLSSLPGIELVLAEGGQHYTTPMRVSSSPLDNLDVRLAIKYGVRRQEFVDRVLGGFGYVGNDTPISPNYAYYNDALEAREYDPDRARFHLEKSGVSASDIPVLKTSDGAFSGAVNAAQLVQASLSEAGIDIDIETVPGDGYWSDVWTVAPWCFVYWNGSVTIGQQLSYYTSGNAYNDAAFNNDRFDTLVANAAVERDETLRSEMYGEAQTILHDEGATLVLGFSQFIHAASSRLGHGELGGRTAVDDHSLARRWWWKEA